MEDAFKAGFLSPYKIIAANNDIYTQISRKLMNTGIEASDKECRELILDLFSEVWIEPINDQKSLSLDDTEYDIKTVNNFIDSYTFSEDFASNGYQRNHFSSYLVSRFINGISIDKNTQYPILSKVAVDDKTKKLINILKHFSYVFLINSSRLKVVENRGYDIIKKMFERLSSDEGYKLLPEDYQELYVAVATDQGKKRVICDFIAGMTDRYAIEFYGRLFSENPKTIFKPL